MSDSGTPREAKKQLKDGDRVELDVGGTKFVSAVSTLSYESSYFCSKFSHHWDDDDEERYCFIDQDPIPFAILLDYMRSGLIRVKDITESVLAQAVFFGMNRLESAVKIRAYRNLYPYSKKSEEEALSAFDEEFGGTLQAISAGVLPSALTLEPEPKKEYASIILLRQGGRPEFGEDHYEQDSAAQVAIKTSPGNETDLSTNQHHGKFFLTGALNKLFFHGFTEYEKDMLEENRYKGVYTFSRIVPIQQDESTKIFIDSKSPVNVDTKKTLALMLDNSGTSSYIYFAPEGYNGDDETVKWSTEIQDEDITWLVQRSYAHREVELERLFSEPLDQLVDLAFDDSETIRRRVRIFSRPL